MNGMVQIQDELRTALATQTPDHNLASAGDGTSVEAPDAEAVATRRVLEPIGDIEGVRCVWWSLARQGHRLPAERGIILIDGFQSTKSPARRR